MILERIGQLYLAWSDHQKDLPNKRLMLDKALEAIERLVLARRGALNSKGRRFNRKARLGSREALASKSAAKAWKRILTGQSPFIVMPF